MIAAFGRQFAKTNLALEEFHRYLLSGQDTRNIGDYDLGPGIDENASAEQIKRAEKFVELAKSGLG